MINDSSKDCLFTQYVSPNDCNFFKTENGFVGAKLNGIEYKRVILTRSLPLTNPQKYICISDVNKNELGIIEDISKFSEEQNKLIRDELESRYFCPQITEITSIKEKFGNLFFDVKIGHVKKHFTVRDVSKSIRYHNDGFDLVDVEGNRFSIASYEKLPQKCKRKLEPYLY